MTNNTDYSTDSTNAETSQAATFAGNAANEETAVPAKESEKSAGKKPKSAKTKSGGNGGAVIPGTNTQGSGKPPRKRIAPVFIDFQPDAIELETQPVPRQLYLIQWTITLFILATIGWAYWTKIEMFVTAQGRLVPTTEPIMIQAAAGSPIKQIHVRFGDIVKPGQLLATLDSTVAAADVHSFETRLNSAQARMARLKAEQAQQRQFLVTGHEQDADWIAEFSLFQSRWLAFETQQDEIVAEIENFQAQISGNDDEIDGLQSALRIHEDVEATMKKLAEKGSQSINNYLSQKLNRQEVALKIVNLINKNAQLKHSIEAAQKRLQRVSAERIAEINNEIVKTRNEVTMLETDLEKATRADELSQLRVPEDTAYDAFYVLEASDRTSGSVVRETDPLFKLMPLDDELRIEAEIQGKDIGDVRHGDKAIIKLDALPYQRHGTLKGKLSTISEGSFEKKEGVAESAFFKSYVTLTERRIDNPPEGFRLVPGMTCKVELRVGKRRVIDYFLYPLLRHLDQSMREPSARPQQTADGEVVTSGEL